MIHRVKFIANSGIYRINDVAGFPLDVCERLVSGGGKGGRPVAVWVDAPPNGKPSTHKLNIDEVRQLVSESESIEELRALRESELAHPKHKAGRKGALEALDDRIAELEDEEFAASQGQEGEPEEPAEDAEDESEEPDEGADEDEEG